MANILERLIGNLEGTKVVWGLAHINEPITAIDLLRQEGEGMTPDVWQTLQLAADVFQSAGLSIDNLLIYYLKNEEGLIDRAEMRRVNPIIGKEICNRLREHHLFKTVGMSSDAWIVGLPHRVNVYKSVNQVRKD